MGGELGGFGVDDVRFTPLKAWQELPAPLKYVNSADIFSEGRMAGQAMTAPAPKADRAQYKAVLRTPLTGDGALDLALIELFFFAYRDFTSDPDQILARYGMGRAHHRVLHFVNRMPGLTVAELLDVLKITKQSLARVLKQLIDAGHVAQVPGPRDRRQRLLFPTPKGRDLALALAKPQSQRIAAALDGTGARERTAVEAFLTRMVDPDWRERLDTSDGVGTMGRASQGA
jgi:DNA-binding MarR family transcriptional regulator